MLKILITDEDHILHLIFWDIYDPTSDHIFRMKYTFVLRTCAILVAQGIQPAEETMNKWLLFIWNLLEDIVIEG